MRPTLATLTLSLLLFTAGCIGTRGGQLPPVELAQIAHPPASADVSFTMVVKKEGSEQDTLRTQMSEALQNALQQAGATVVTTAEPVAPTRIAARITVDGDQPAEMLMTMASVITAGVFPMYASTKIALSAGVEGRDGQTRTYEYSDTYGVWGEIFLLPFAWSDYAAKSVGEQLMNDLARSLVRDMQRDGFLPAPSAGAAAS